MALPSSWTERSPESSQPPHPIWIQVAIAGATLPLLGALTLGDWLGHSVGLLGDVSEELLRGDRLPILSDLPHPSTPSAQD